MPPTLIASIYGMNVKLPVQESPFAFVLVMICIVLSAILPIVWFKKKKLL
jgi:magnesium transporter